MTTASQERLALSVEEAARQLGIGRTLAWAKVRDGTIRSIRLGDRVLIPVEVLRQVLAKAVTL